MVSKGERYLDRAVQEQELLEVRKKKCPFADQLRGLRGRPDAMVSGLVIPCDHTLARAIDWARAEGLDIERVLAGLRDFGGYCGCEVLFKVSPDKLGRPG